jgi:short-subunit dehydrogenase involved in D-alanine esterification of teichoic acids
MVNLISSLPTAYTVYITSRSGSDLPSPSSSSTFVHRKLDISDSSSVKALAAEVKEAHPDGIDAIINNAGVNLNPEGYGQETIKNTMKTNFYGTKAVRDQVRQASRESDVYRCAMPSSLSSRKGAGLSMSPASEDI